MLGQVISNDRVDDVAPYLFDLFDKLPLLRFIDICLMLPSTIAGAFTDIEGFGRFIPRVFQGINLERVFRHVEVEQRA